LFTRLKDEGVIPPPTRFQVSMPTTIAIMWPFIVPDHRRRLMPVWERALAREASLVAAAIPHEELAMQWDVAVEFSLIENVIPGGELPPLEEILDQIVRHSRYVPEDVQFGYHLCYGDSPSEPGGQGRHFKQPQDASKLVMVANAISRGAQRPINWIHMPVPIERDDDAYFEPLRDLELRPETELYLGLVHYEDGLEGTQRRIATAVKFANRFGVATECGMARRPRERVPELLEIQRDAVVPASPAPAATR
jgi:methionine synthase II (cobalamin-independent)